MPRASRLEACSSSRRSFVQAGASFDKLRTRSRGSAWEVDRSLDNRPAPSASGAWGIPFPRREQRPTTPASIRWRSATGPSSTAIRPGSRRFLTTPSCWPARLRKLPHRFSQRALTNVSGFNGADGVFRFRTDGTNERGLAVMEIDNNAATVLLNPRAAEFCGRVKDAIPRHVGGVARTDRGRMTCPNPSASARPAGRRSSYRPQVGR